MVYTAVTLIDGNPIPAAVLNDMSAAVASHDIIVAAGGIQQTVWAFRRAPAVESTLLSGFSAEATFYTTPSAITVQPSTAYWFDVSVACVAYAGGDLEFSVAGYDGATVIGKTGSLHVRTTGGYRTAQFGALHVTGGAQTSITPVYKAVKLGGAGLADIRASSINPFSITITALGVTSSAVNT